ncbi:putative membrane protein [Rhodopirellula maiorica SM1]|uniref:Putative membrane protein n=1 Tax=Rhodopirellula maiorica SM1 TaxID=1265738 RepID=M5RGU4_9BACT|nr:DUF2585 family protein [Rhodopirellula maiorica]EMI18603.1 putative membrane protein [Rhodopirellula maiorica SM1]
MNLISSPSSTAKTAYGLVGIAGLMTAILAMLGRVWWCQIGDLSPWSWEIWSSHNSQHLIDPYSLSHLEHGFALWVIFHLLAGKKVSQSSILITIAAIEAVWEITENTPWMIQRYRETTISLDYFGDSILNSISDYLMCVTGTVIAIVSRHRFGIWMAVLVVALLEIASILWIRDSLALNIIMLAFPIEAIRDWQSAGK